MQKIALIHRNRKRVPFICPLIRHFTKIDRSVSWWYGNTVSSVFWTLFNAYTWFVDNLWGSVFFFGRPPPPFFILFLTSFQAALNVGYAAQEVKEMVDVTAFSNFSVLDATGWAGTNQCFRCHCPSHTPNNDVENHVSKIGDQNDPQRPQMVQKCPAMC